MRARTVRNIGTAIGAIVMLALIASACAPAAAPTTAAAKWCKGVNIVFFPGGPEGGVFAVNVYNGAVQAQADLGPSVQYVWSAWDPQKMIEQFKSSEATKPDGIAVMGHPGDTAFDPLIDDAESKGIIVTAQNTELPNMLAKYQAAGFGYVGASNYTAGQALGAEAVKRGGFKSGDRAMVWGLLSQPTRGLRTKGVIDALKAAGMTVDYIEIELGDERGSDGGHPHVHRLCGRAPRCQAGRDRSRWPDRHGSDLPDGGRQETGRHLLGWVRHVTGDGDGHPSWLDHPGD